MTERFDRDLAFMQNPDQWPRYPRLPLKRRGNIDLSDPHALALLVADGQPTIYFGNLYLEAEKIIDLERREYASFQALAVDYTVD